MYECVCVRMCRTRLGVHVRMLNCACMLCVTLYEVLVCVCAYVCACTCVHVCVQSVLDDAWAVNFNSDVGNTSLSTSKIADILYSRQYTRVQYNIVKSSSVQSSRVQYAKYFVPYYSLISSCTALYAAIRTCTTQT